MSFFFSTSRAFRAWRPRILGRIAGVCSAAVGTIHLVKDEEWLRRRVRDAEDGTREFLTVRWVPDQEPGHIRKLLESHGMCIVEDLIPFHRKTTTAQDLPIGPELKQRLEGIVFKGRPLMDKKDGRIDLEVAGAFIGALLAMPLPLPGSFLAGAVTGSASGQVLSTIVSLQKPTLDALLEMGCNSAMSAEGVQKDAAAESVTLAQKFWSRDDSRGGNDQDSLLPSPSWISYFLFGPLASAAGFGKGPAAEPKPALTTEYSDSGAGGNVWKNVCFYDEDRVTKDNIPWDIMEDMRKAHCSAWNEVAEALKDPYQRTVFDGLATEDEVAQTRLAQKLKNFAIVRAAEKLWLRIVQPERPQSEVVNDEDADAAKSERPAFRLSRGHLIWIDAHCEAVEEAQREALVEAPSYSAPFSTSSAQASASSPASEPRSERGDDAPAVEDLTPASQEPGSHPEAAAVSVKESQGEFLEGGVENLAANLSTMAANAGSEAQEAIAKVVESTATGAQQAITTAVSTTNEAMCSLGEALVDETNQPPENIFAIPLPQNIEEDNAKALQVTESQQETRTTEASTNDNNDCLPTQTEDGSAPILSPKQSSEAEASGETSWQKIVPDGLAVFVKGLAERVGGGGKDSGCEEEKHKPTPEPVIVNRLCWSKLESVDEDLHECSWEPGVVDGVTVIVPLLDMPPLAGEDGGAAASRSSSSSSSSSSSFSPLPRPADSSTPSSTSDSASVSPSAATSTAESAAAAATAAAASSAIGLEFLSCSHSGFCKAAFACRVEADLKAGSAVILDNHLLRRFWCVPKKVDRPVLLLVFEYRHTGSVRERHSEDELSWLSNFAPT
eukprot:CAMPEP_0206438672 /NCGR_PEP_ID=MMETSP0324_2-20121206/11775_1 /ASSEMBLY_ACC=CAM_ASM_000836 /TAXON_ID=2866 /ORGANISM="Crypthecodinium cohnii, Strain Seligo" /LENGTH=839 /DNA_ID=CAMNT_0053906187 /DNA_START=19 /DNA_END=2534 /DNA_ORIENTATION=+